jgi:hypothetical protein
MLYRLVTLSSAELVHRLDQPDAPLVSVYHSPSMYLDLCLKIISYLDKYRRLSKEHAPGEVGEEKGGRDGPKWESDINFWFLDVRNG